MVNYPRRDIARCDRCLFWRATYEGKGECRRFPPSVQGMVATKRHPDYYNADSRYLILRDAHAAAFPLTEPDSWCGEYKHPRST